MIPEALTALAAAGGKAVVQAAGSDIWVSFRDRLAALFSRDKRHDPDQVAAILDQSAAELAQADADKLEQIRVRVEASWQTRLEDFLAELTDAEQKEIAQQLRETVRLADTTGNRGSVSADAGSVAIGGNAYIKAEGGSAAAVTMGDVSIGRPSPDPTRAGQTRS